MKGTDATEFAKVPDLFAALHALLDQVPAGRVTTYGALGMALGAVSAARWVASYLLDPAGPVGLPRHRVLLKNGALGSFWTGNPDDKWRLLAEEGVPVVDDAVDLTQYGILEFQGPQPLLELTEMQSNLMKKLHLKTPGRFPESVGGVDVSYLSSSDGGPVEGIAAYVRVDVATGEVLWSHTLRGDIRFPYIPGFLSFRELPLHLALLDEVRRQGELADVVFVDGNGVLHYRSAGIATHLGIAADCPTIGIGKTLLCGSVDLSEMRAGESRPVCLNDEVVAMALQPRSTGRPIFVSPGHRVDLPFAIDLAQKLLHGGRVPVPIKQADSISRAAVRNALSTR